jgi:16S rRNA (guanine527-N7)-methyltransferase
VNELEFAARLRAAAPQAEQLSREAVEQLVTYWTVLAKWNAVINLTALPLDPPSDAALRRLLVEPLAASQYFPRTAKMWFDLGSGGGSPAIPLKILHPDLPLVLVEVRGRKAAFLREAVRALMLPNVEVAALRFEQIAQDRPHAADLVTARAVRADAALAVAVQTLLSQEGHLLSFQTGSKPLEIHGLTCIESHQLDATRPSLLASYVPRGTSVDQ